MTESCEIIESDVTELVEALDDLFGEGYAESHPELLIQMLWNSTVISATWQISKALRNIEVTKRER